MCDPVTATLVVATAVGGYASYQTSVANKEYANYQAAVDRNNQQSAEWAATDALDRGAREEMQVRQRVKAAKGEQVTRLAANGLSLDSGSPLAILEDTDYLGEVDTLTVRDNARREAWGYKEQARNYGASAGLNQARANAENPALSAGLSLLGGAPKVAASWYR